MLGGERVASGERRTHLNFSFSPLFLPKDFPSHTPLHQKIRAGSLRFYFDGCRGAPGGNVERELNCSGTGRMKMVEQLYEYMYMFHASSPYT